MTVFIPLDPLVSQPATPSYLVQAKDRDAQLAKVVRAIVKARKIVVVCGACSSAYVHPRFGN
jgi:NAD-dependent histone deacetylase SIR2